MFVKLRNSSKCSCRKSFDFMEALGGNGKDQGTAIVYSRRKDIVAGAVSFVQLSSRAVILSGLRAIPDCLPLASGNSDKSLKASHIICRRLGQWLTEVGRASFGLSLRPVGGTMDVLIVYLLVLAVDRMRPIHDGCSHGGL
jgi:hypothetical protein